MMACFAPYLEVAVNRVTFNIDEYYYTNNISFHDASMVVPS
jgi:hypothetical protein